MVLVTGVHPVMRVECMDAALPVAGVYRAVMYGLKAHIGSLTWHAHRATVHSAVAQPWTLAHLANNLSHALAELVVDLCCAHTHTDTHTCTRTSLRISIMALLPLCRAHAACALGSLEMYVYYEPTFVCTKKRSPPAQFCPQFRYAALSATWITCVRVAREHTD